MYCVGVVKIGGSSYHSSKISSQLVQDVDFLKRIFEGRTEEFPIFLTKFTVSIHVDKIRTRSQIIFKANY